MKGKLTDQPLAELIREIADKSLSGTLRLVHDRAQTAVYFEAGQLVYAAANLKTLRLREYLIKRGAISETEQLRFPVKLSDFDLAEALVSTRTMRRNDVDALLGILVSDVLRVALLWTDGVWEFDERARLAKPVQLNLDLQTLLRDAAQRLPYAVVSQRLRNSSEMISRSSEISPTTDLQPTESFILSRLDEDLKLGELIMLSGLPEIQTQHTVYGLLLRGLLKREFWQNAFRTDGSKPAAKAATPAPTAAGLTVNQVEQSDSWAAAAVENEELEKFLQRLRNATNYYDVLELPRTATPTEIKESYYAMARRYHPDRFHLKSGTSLHSAISSAFARVTQSYETLIEANARSAYDQTLQRSDELARTQKANEPASQKTAADFDPDTDSPDSDVGRADYHFREGFGALQQGRISAAIKHLSNAARLRPDEAKYRAHYGRALAADDNTRRLAENELQTAVKLQPGDITFRVMLAELYFQLNFHRRARTELDRALAIDPRNGAANSLLRKLEKSRKVG